MHTGLTYLGRINSRDDVRPFGIWPEDRRAHLYALGKTGTGKSSFLEFLIRQDQFPNEVDRLAEGGTFCIGSDNIQNRERRAVKLRDPAIASSYTTSPAPDVAAWLAAACGKSGVQARVANSMTMTLPSAILRGSGVVRIFTSPDACLLETPVPRRTPSTSRTLLRVNRNSLFDVSQMAWHTLRCSSCAQ